MNRSFLRTLPLALCTVLLLGGCSATPQKSATQKDAAARNWNAARAGVLYSLAREQYQGGIFDKCRQTINDALKMDANNAPLHVLAAKLDIEENQLEQAERELAQARTLDPANSEADYLIGIIYQRWQKPDIALEAYTRASDKQPAELSYILARAEMLVCLSRSAEALDLLKDKVNYFENSSAIRDAVGQLLVSRGHYDQAVDMFQQAAILSPDDATIKEHLGMALYYAHEFAQAERVLVHLIENDRYMKRADLLATLGDCRFELGRFREARDTCQTAVDLESGSAGLWRGLAKASIACNDTARAELSLKKAAAIEPASSETQLLLGYLRLRQNRLEEALDCFNRATLNDKDPTLGLCMSGYVLEKLGRPDQAIRCYGQALKLKPTDELASKLMTDVRQKGE